jgi:crossover junction endodeoxyribonuclease RuvC
MRILGIDPGIGRTGWGIVDVHGPKFTAIDYGCIETPKEHSIGERLEALYAKVISIIEECKPEALGIEELFFNTNVSTALIVGQARGVVFLAATQHKLPIGVYTPLQVKMAVTGYGRAEKNQVGQMVKTLLHLSSIPKPDDTADALAIALTHAFSYKMKK